MAILSREGSLRWYTLLHNIKELQESTEQAQLHQRQVFVEVVLAVQAGQDLRPETAIEAIASVEDGPIIKSVEVKG